MATNPTQSSSPPPPSSNIPPTIKSPEEKLWEEEEKRREREREQRSGSRDQARATRQTSERTTPGPQTQVDRLTWAQMFLQRIGAPATQENLTFMLAWMAKENTNARYNPLATSQSMPGATPFNFNKVGQPLVRNYASLQEGIDATVKTISNGRYKTLLTSLRSGRASNAFSANDLNVWGGSTAYRDSLRALYNARATNSALYRSDSSVKISTQSSGGSTGDVSSVDGAATSTANLTDQELLDRAHEMLGADAQWLAIPELRAIYLKAARDSSLSAANIRGLIANSNWMRDRNQAQRTYARLKIVDPKTLDRMIEVQAAKLAELYRDLFGIDVDLSAFRKDADNIVAGNTAAEVWLWNKQKEALAVPNSPYALRRAREQADIRDPEASISNLAGSLDDLWEKWMGRHRRADPALIRRWAEDIFWKRRSQEDFQTFIESQSANLYPRKNPKESYVDYASVPRQMISRMLGLSDVRDDDPYLVSYVRGEIGDLNTLEGRLRSDPRHDLTPDAIATKEAIGVGVLRRLGFTI